MINIAELNIGESQPVRRTNISTPAVDYLSSPPVPIGAALSCLRKLEGAGDCSGALLTVQQLLPTVPLPTLVEVSLLSNTLAHCARMLLKSCHAHDKLLTTT